MPIESTTERAGKKPRVARGGNSLVDKVADSLGAPPLESAADTVTHGADDTVDRVVAEARSNLGPVVTLGEAPEIEIPDPPRSRQPEPEPVEEPEPYNPFKRPEGTPPKPTARATREEGLADRLRSNQPTPSTKRLGALGKKLPGAERAKVHKRMDNGQLAYIGEYTDGDLSQSQDIESFLSRYIKPVYGAGEYQITGVDAHGREFDMGIVNLLAPLSPNMQAEMQPQQDTPYTLVKQLMERQAQQPPQRDPIEMLGQLHELKRKMDPPPQAPRAEGKSNDLLLAVVGGITTVASSLVTMLAQPKPVDPLMAALLHKLLSDDKPRGGGDALPPMPPPADPTEQLKNLAAVVQSLRGPETKTDDRLMDYLMKERMSPTDVLSLVNSVKGEKGTDDFKKSMENVSIMFNAVNQLRSHTEPGAGAGFWDAISSLVGNKELVTSAASAIRGGGGRPPQQLEAPPTVQQHHALPAPQDPLAMRARANAAKRLELEERELAFREQRLNEAAVPQAARRVIDTPAPSAPPPLEVSPEQQQAIETARTQNGGKLPQLPPNIADFVNNYVEAKDDADLVSATIEMLFSLGESPDWKPYAEVIFSFIAQGDQPRFLNYMASFFIGLRTINLIEDNLAKKVMQALATNFQSLVDTVKEQMAKAAEEVDGDDEEDEGGDEDMVEQIELGDGPSLVDGD